MSQSDSSHQKAIYYPQSARLSSQELETLHGIQESIKSRQQITALLDRPEMIDGYMDEFQKIDDRLENLKTEEPPKGLALADIDSFATAIETIRFDMGEVIKLFWLAVENTKEIKWIHDHPQNGKEDTIRIEENKSLFRDHIRRCWQLLIHAEKIATDSGVVDTTSQNPAEKAAG